MSQKSQESLEFSKQDASKEETEESVHEEEEEQEATHEKTKPRQDAYVIFATEKDMRTAESIQVKAAHYTGIVVRLKQLTPAAMANLLLAIEMDAGCAKPPHPTEAAGTSVQGENAATPASRAPQVAKAHGHVKNLRFEECRFSRKGALLLLDFLKSKPILETLGLVSVSFEDKTDFKKITEGMQQSASLSKITFQHMTLDEELFGKAIGRTLTGSRSIRELDVSNVNFEHPKCFYDLCSAILNERCRLNILKLRGIVLTQLEAKILRYILMKNKQLHTLDLSYCRSDDPENFNCFLEKLDQFCHIRYLTLQNMKPDLSASMEAIGAALADNEKLEALILSENKIKWVQYQAFWQQLVPNTSLVKLNLHKTDLSDRVVEQMCKYLEQPKNKLADLDLSKNTISDTGLKLISQSLKKSGNLQYLNLSQNRIRDEGLVEFSNYLKQDTSLLELAIGSNLISNEGIVSLSGFLSHNKTLKHLDISKNAFSDFGFSVFASEIAKNDGIEYLDISKNRDISDEDSLITLVDAIGVNKKLVTLNITGISIRKPFLKMHFEINLQKNISLQVVEGKYPKGIIEEELYNNQKIMSEILPLYQRNYKPQKGSFDLARVEKDKDQMSFLNMKDRNQSIVKSSFKLISTFDIRVVDFTNTNFHDDNLRQLSGYLLENPNLRSLVLDQNIISDSGMAYLAQTLEHNTKLCHLSFRQCPNITNKGLEELANVLTKTNMVLYQVEFDYNNFDKKLSQQVLKMSNLNKNIIELLKPVKVTCYYDEDGTLQDIADTRTQSQSQLMLALPLNEGQPQSKSGLNNEGHGQSHRTASSSVDVGASAALEVSHNSGRPRGLSHNEGPSNGEEINQSNSQLPFQHLSAQNQHASEHNLLSKPQQDNQHNENNNQASHDRLHNNQWYKGKELIEVRFDENANIAQCFESSLKVWKIFKPSLIRVENKNLNDEHIEQLCQFLAECQVVQRLCMRRNKIGNEGAKRLAKFIREEDETLTHIDLTRNKISENGGHALLAALSSTMRIAECKITYGNVISSKMARLFDREVKANNQANSSIKTQNQQKEKNGNVDFKNSKIKKYELMDKGPDFMRCAIKTTELKNILMLSLPDNMLGLEESRMLSDMIRKNSPLRILNLKQNQLDADCAVLLADALIFNDKLQILDLSFNILGDYGVQILLNPIIRKRLQETELTPKKTPILKQVDAIKAKNLVDCKKLIKQLPILSEIKMLNIEDNDTSTEVYKQIWLALELNEAISIYVEDPAVLERKQNAKMIIETETNDEQEAKDPISLVHSHTVYKRHELHHAKAANRVGIAPPSSKKQEQRGVGGVRDDSQNEDSVSHLQGTDQSQEDSRDGDDEDDENDASEKEDTMLKKQRHAKVLHNSRTLKQRCRVSCLGCAMKICCYRKDEEDGKEGFEDDSEEEQVGEEEKGKGGKDEIDLDKLSCFQICCWKFIRSKKKAKQFHTSEDSLISFEKSGYQNVVALILSFNYLLLYGVAIAPFILIFKNGDQVVPGDDNSLTDDCSSDPSLCIADDPSEEDRKEFFEQFNFIMILINGLVIAYSLICELIIIAMQKDQARVQCCNGYLLCQVITGISSRAVILLSAQLVAAFLRHLDALSYTWGVVIGILLVLSQARAFQMWLAALKLDLNCLLPRIERNYEISVATHCLGPAVIYKRLSVEPSVHSKQVYQDTVAQRNLLKQLTGLDEDDLKQKKKETKKSTNGNRSSQTSICCKFGSPKYWQMMLNDIPLLVCLPFAYVKGVADQLTILITLIVAAYDLLSMLTVLGSVDELSISSYVTYKKIVERNLKMRPIMLNMVQVIDQFVEDQQQNEDSFVDDVDDDQ